MMTKQHIDPEYARWKRKYPMYPGTEKCVELLRSNSVRGTWIDIICHEIEQYSITNPSKLIEAVERRENHGIRRVLLGILENIACPESISVFIKILESGEEDERDYAVRGLRRIDNKEARTALVQVAASAEKRSAETSHARDR
ncbi:MAG: hypothetical protein QNJ97_20230 [Myxococcota bacterium]|nr:hypothetical protein [Myxococcota bacterium]